MKVELSVYRRILRSVHAVRKRFSWSSDALFCVFGISASQAEFSAAGYGANMQEILHNCFMRPSITDDKHDKYSERLRAAFGLLRYLEQLHKHTEFRQVAESREEFVSKTYQNMNGKECENDKTPLEQVVNETEEAGKETESLDESRAESVKAEHACEEAQILTAKQENLEQQQQKQSVKEEESKQKYQQEQEQKVAAGDDALDTIDSPGTVVTNATLLLDYYNHQLIPLVMRVLLTPEEKIPSYAYMLPPEPFYAFEISERRSFAHIVDVLHVLSTVASSSAAVYATHPLNWHKPQTQQKNSHVYQKQEQAEKERECNAQYDSDNTSRTGKDNNNDNKEFTQNTKEEGLTKETANDISCSDTHNLESNLCKDEQTKENTIDKEYNNENKYSNTNKMCTAHMSASLSPSLSWPKTISEMTNAVKYIPTRTRVMTDNLEVQVFSHYLCSGVNPERKSYKSKAENVNCNNNQDKKSTNSNVERIKVAKTTRAQEEKIEQAEREKQYQKSSNEQETSNTSDTTCKQNAEIGNKESGTNESAEQQRGKHNNTSNNTSNRTKDNYSQKGSASSTSSSRAEDNNESEGAEAVSFSEEMKRYAFHSAKNDNAHLFQITIVVRNMCDENEKEKLIYYQTLSHHFTFLNYHDHTSVETVGPGLCGNKVHLEPGNSHVFQTGAVVNGTDGVFRGTLQVIKIRKNGQMSTFDAVIAPTRLSMPEEMIEETETNKANEPYIEEKENDSNMQPITKDESVETQVNALSESSIASTPTATSSSNAETNDVADNDVNDNHNDKCDENKKAQCINDDDAQQSTPNADIEQCNIAECKDDNLDITSTVTKLENSELKESEDDKDSNNTITANTCKLEMGDVAEQTAVKEDDDAAKECKEAEENDKELLSDSTEVTTESKSSDSANSDDATLPPHEKEENNVNLQRSY